jgi:hypothetical protein
MLVCVALYKLYTWAVFSAEFFFFSSIINIKALNPLQKIPGIIMTAIINQVLLPPTHPSTHKIHLND